MSKANSIRKKALGFAKKREWDKALGEYTRLAEIDSHNPNVFNELGDLHLKLNNRGEAFAAFHSAIDAYTRVGLLNNAVAVCKKIIRLNPNDHYVYGKLARLRNGQGFKKDAAKYAMNFLDLVCEDASINPDDLKQQVSEIGEEIDHSPEVLEKIADYLAKWEFNTEAAAVLDKLAKAYSSGGMEKKSQETRTRMEALGYAAATHGGPDESPPHAASPEPPGAAAAAEDGTMSGFENHRVELDPAAARTETGTSDEEEPVPPPDPEVPMHDMETEESSRAAAARQTTQTATQEMDPPAGEPLSATDLPPGPDVTEEIEVKPIRPLPDPPPDAAVEPRAPSSAGEGGQPTDKPASVDPPELEDGEVWVPHEELPDPLRKGNEDASGEVVKVSDIVSQFDAKVKADVDVEDYRSHYDLGMAYLEMDLLPEAIREFQFASNSGLYRVRCLEMIGLCFLKQNQPRLAIKQLEKGLDLVDEGDHESLGLQYNLGLAYEMTGDTEKARMCFEDVYVVDVAFRDVSEKVKN